MTDSATDAGANIKVVCRFRPLNRLEVEKGAKFCISQITNDSVVVSSASENSTTNSTITQQHQFTFDRAFGTNSDQEAVWKYAGEPMVQATLDGYNAAIIAYGQTGSGKTHTMMGPDGAIDVEDDTEKGIIPRAVHRIFAHMEDADEGMEFSLVVSYVEIYQEKIRDLLDVSKDDLKIGEIVHPAAAAGHHSGHSSGGSGTSSSSSVYIKDVTLFSVVNEDEVYEIMRSGAKNRATAATGMNAGSSRSHSIFSLTLSQENTKTGVKVSGKLYLVDLAGSETVAKTGVSGTQLEELKKINRSLSALGGVINALTEHTTVGTTGGGSSGNNNSNNGRRTGSAAPPVHIPYRDSKLTRLLQDCLGGNSKTALVINCSPAAWNEMETLSTLRFGKRAKAIKNKPLLNLERSPEELKRVVANLEARIAEYTRREKEWLRAYRTASFPSVLHQSLSHIAAAAEMDARMDQMEGSSSSNGGSMAGIAPPATTIAQLLPVATTPPYPPPATLSNQTGGGGVGITGGGGSNTKDAGTTPGKGKRVYIGDGDENVIHEDNNDNDNDEQRSNNNNADDGSEVQEEDEDEVKWEETYDDVVASRDALEVENKNILDLLSQASSNIKMLRASIDEREVRIAELQATIERGFFVDTNGGGAGEGGGEGGGVKREGEGSHTADELRALQETYENSLHQNQELQLEIEDLRAKLAESIENAKQLEEEQQSKPSKEGAGAGAEESRKTESLAVEEEVWENQRIYGVMGWSSTLLPADPPSWSDRTGTLARAREAVRLPPVFNSYSGGGGSGGSSLPEAWYWATNWSATKKPTTNRSRNNRSNNEDEDEEDPESTWEYAPDFSVFYGNTSTTSSNTHHGSPSLSSAVPSFVNTVRRRKWLRVRKTVSLALPIPNTYTEAVEAGTKTSSEAHIGNVSSLLERLQQQDQTVSKLEIDVSRKTDIIAEYEMRVQSLVRQLTDVTNIVNSNAGSGSGNGNTSSSGTILSSNGMQTVSGSGGSSGGGAGSAPIEGARILSSNSAAPVRIRGGAGRGASLGGGNNNNNNNNNSFSPGGGGSRNNRPSLSGNNNNTDENDDTNGSKSFFRGLLKRLSSSPSKAGAAALQSTANNNESNNKASTDNSSSSSAAAADDESAEKVAILAQFFKACEEGDLRFVQTCITNKSVASTSTDRSGRTGILYAGRGGQLSLMQYLVKNGCSLTGADKDARNVLAYAARRGHADVTSWLLNNGLNVSASDVHGLTPLHQAVLGRHTEVVELLLKAGADLRAKDSNGNTPYRLAKRFLSDDNPESRAVLLSVQRWVKALPTKEEQSAAAGRMMPDPSSSNASSSGSLNNTSLSLSLDNGGGDNGGREGNA